MKLSKIFWFVRASVLMLFAGSIGRNCLIGKPLFILGLKNIFFKNNVRIFPHARIEVHNKGRIIFEDNVSIGQNFHIISSNNDLIISKNVMISGNVFISNVDHDYEDITKPVSEQSLIDVNTVIGENCFIGYGAVIKPGTQLGKHCIIGANSSVKGIFPDYSVIAGNPARVIKLYNLKTKKWERVY